MWYLCVVGYQSFEHLDASIFTLKMEAARSSEMQVSCHITIWCHNSEDHDLNLQCYDNLKFHINVALGYSESYFTQSNNGNQNMIVFLTCSILPLQPIPVPESSFHLSSQGL